MIATHTQLEVSLLATVWVVSGYVLTAEKDRRLAAVSIWTCLVQRQYNQCTTSKHEIRLPQACVSCFVHNQTVVMGKRHSTFTGLSKVALEVFGVPQGEASKQSAHTTESDANSAGHDQAGKSNARKASAVGCDQSSSPGHRPAHKTSKVGLLGPKHEKLDATGLVPYYTDASDVPEHLKKCMSSYFSPNLVNFDKLLH